ncbi:MAG: hypothetical protein ACKOCT_05220 [Alphaproteobacteria bacterium]
MNERATVGAFTAATDRRRGLLGSVVAGLAMLAACGGGAGGGSGADAVPPTPTPTPGFERSLGFVVSSFGIQFPEVPGESCPDGLARGPVEYAAAGLPVPPDDCGDPLSKPSPGFPAMLAPGTLDGFDLDVGGTAGCAHAEFSGPDGSAGIDDQLWRAIGCIRGFQEGDIVGGVVDTAVRDGSMTILVDVRGVDDPRNDDDVTVQVFASREAPPAGGDGSVLPWGTLAIDPDPRFHGSQGRGRIVDGVLEAGPMDVRVRLNIQIVEGELSFQGARLRLAIAPDGSAAGGLHGYAPVDEIYDVFGRQAGTIGGKEAIGYLCSGLRRLLDDQADGDRDPAGGTCRSISSSWRLGAVPAFVAR